MGRYSDAQLTVMRLLAECGWVSKRALHITKYDYFYFTKLLKALCDNDCIRKTGKGRGKCYALNPSARDVLSSINSSRFSSELFEANMLLTRHPDRAMLRGDAAAILSLAGYSVHPDDKPILPAYCQPMPSIPTEADWKALFQNERQYSYSVKSDKRIYVKRLTPVGCYYDAIFLKGLVPKFSNKDNEGVSYSRVCGVLMTPTYLLRVFHSRDVAMKFSITGERNMRSLILSDAVFSGYVPEQNRGVLVFGDDFTAAEKIIEYHVSAGRVKIPQTVKKSGSYVREDKAVGTMLGTTNLGNPLFYLPIERRALELLRIMQYPVWQDTFIRFINGTCFGQNNNTHWCYELEGRQVYILASLNLTYIGIAIRNIVKHPERPVTLVWLDWQHDFFERLIKKHGGYCDVLVNRMTAEYDVNTRITMDEYWRG